MSRLSRAILSWGGSYLALLFVVVVLLVSIVVLKQQWDGKGNTESDLESSKITLASDRENLKLIEQDIDTERAAWQAQQESDAAPLRESLKAKEDELAKAAEGHLETESQFLGAKGAAEIARGKANVARASLEALEAASWPTDFILQRERYAQLNAARAAYAALDQAAAVAEIDKDQLWEQLQGSSYDTVAAERDRILGAIERIFESASPQLNHLFEKRKNATRDILESKRKVQEHQNELDKNFLQRVMTAARAELPLAISIVVGVIAVPLVTKAIFYFLLAPLASQQPPIQIISDRSLPEIPEFNGSAVSVDVQLSPGEELLVHPDFLQGSSQASQKRTQWLLNARLPLSSLASGMYFLTRIRPEAPNGSRVVVSSGNDPLGEVGVVEIPDGAAMVVQPRALAGIVKPDGHPVQITRHWRLNSAHAWLTLQLRYLVFHGPCRLILKGCKGVRMKTPDASQTALISQGLTIGFSANIGYKTVRTAVFFPYLQGKADLFNDMFIGEEGSFVYEVLPNAGRRAGVTGRGLEGVADAVLKVFGI